jgi:ABC-type uncharacterized transport system YnjBCD ATPase subunit
MNRQQNRYEALNVAHITGAGMTRHTVTVRNISKAGARVIADGFTVATGEVVSLDFGSGDVKGGVVRWISGNDIGVLFT